MCLLLETIKYKNGKLYNLPYHEARMERAFEKIFGLPQKIDLEASIKIPNIISDDRLYKCRILYTTKILQTDFLLYQRKKIKTLKLITDDTLSYSHKFENRTCIEKHSKNLGKSEELIFIKKGLLRDASYSNIALYNGKEWHTPKYPLLKGTKRAELLEKGIIKAKMLRPKDLKNYKSISFINAMNDLGELNLEL